MDPWTKPWFFVVAAVVAATIVFVVLVVCAVCMKRLRKQRNKEKGADLVLSRYKLRLKDARIQTTALHPLGQEVNYISDSFRSRCDSSSTPRSLSIDRMSSDADDRLFDPELGRSKSYENLLEDAPTPIVNRSLSMSLNTLAYSESNEPPPSPPVLNFTVTRNEFREQLQFSIKSVEHLPRKFGRKCSSYVKLYFMPGRKESHSTNKIKYTLDPVFDETFTIEDIPEDILQKSAFKLLVFVKEPGTMRHTRVGEVFRLCSNIQFNGSINSVTFSVNLQRKKLKRQSTSEQALFKLLGELFIQLHYQPLTNRMKVLVRKAENLPKTDKLPGNPEHYVIVNLLREDRVVETKETRAQSGYEPFWNEPFLLDLSGDSVDEYRLEFVVMKVRLVHAKNEVLGKVEIGHNTTKTGSAHWHETMVPYCRETLRWHPIIPVRKYPEVTGSP